MDSSGAALRFGDIKDAVAEMNLALGQVPVSSPYYVSALWRETIEYLDYVLELSDQQLQMIRLHTSLFSGDAWFGYMHSPIRTASDEVKEGHHLVQAYNRLTAGLPERFHASEPVPNRFIELAGMHYKNVFLTDDLIRYQRAISNLFSGGVLRDEAPGGPRRVVLEIGGGYGGLAHQMGRILRGTASYVMLDIPIILFYAAVHLRLNNPDAKIYVYTKDSFARRPVAEIVAEHDFVLLPHFLLEGVSEFPRIDLAINILSMQEMTERQVRAYLDFFRAHLNGWFFTENYARHTYNAELDKNLYGIFREYFELHPESDLSQHPDLQKFAWLPFPYLCTPKERPQPFRPQRSQVIARNYEYGW